VIVIFQYLFGKVFRHFFCSINIEHFRMEKKLKNANIFYCSICDFGCSKQSNFEKHKLTLKHKKRVVSNVFEQKNAEKCQTFTCSDCHKTYMARSSLWYHSRKCKEKKNGLPNEKENNLPEEPTDKDLIMMLIKENSELKNMVLEVCQKIHPLSNTINTYNTNSHNKTFNLNVFLNETCKDAMNINDFVDSLKLQLTDLESVGKLGYVNGISNIIVKNLNSLDETERPIHCTDTKRETIYIKDENKWEKEGQDNIKLKKAIKRIAHKNSKLLYDFKEKYPDCTKSESNYSDQYNKLIIEAMGGMENNDIDKEGKIIKKIIKTVAINKDNYL